jgi:predicted PurR-regulated permease PerM
MASTLDHIEKTVGEAYRKEIDQEENVWRSLAFFAAVIAFQMTAVSQALTRLPNVPDGVWWDSILATVAVAILVFVAILFLVASIAPARFTYVSNETALLSYARGLDQDELEAAEQDFPAVDALAILKATLANQYSVAAHHNRQINQRRAFYRAMAGLATFGSAFFTLFLVIRLMLHYLLNTA